MISFTVGKKNIPEYINWNNFSVKDIDSEKALIYVGEMFKNIDGDLEKLNAIGSMTKLKSVNFYSSDFNVAKYFSTLFESLKVEKTFSLLDDFENRDRSYIDFTGLGYSNSEIPYSYIQWGVNRNNYTSLNCGNLPLTKEGIITSYLDSADFKKPTEQDISKINEIIDSAEQISNLSKVDKVVWAANYLQSKVQYVTGKESIAKGKKYVTKGYSSEKYGNCDSLSNILDDNIGKCANISRTFVLLLNNPKMDVDCRLVTTNTHTYCVINDDESETSYAVDPTFLITRNQNRVAETLKATKFSDDYLLVGQDIIGTSQDHLPNTQLKRPIETQMIDRNLIYTSLEKLKKNGVKFEYPEEFSLHSECESEKEMDMEI